MDRRSFVAAAGSAGVLGLNACGGGGLPPPPPPPPPPAIAWDSLSSRLQGTLLRPDSSGFDVAAPVYNGLYDATVPQAIARCASAADIAQALAFAQQNRLAVTARSGGHGYTGNATTTGLVIDVGPMDSIVLVNGRATIGAGAKLVDIYDQLSTRGVCIPSGSCETIGVAGIALGGGIGVLDRAYGLTCDSLVSAQVVLADGSIVACDANQHADLFWALRGGGGGNFGIVASLTFDTFATRDLTSFSADFAWADAARVFAAWQAWPQVLPDTVWSGLVLGTTGVAGGDPVIELSGIFIGSDTDFLPIWNQFLADAGATPTSHGIRTGSFRDTLLAGCGGLSVSQCHLPRDSSDGQVRRNAFVASSDFFDTPLPAEGIRAMLDAVAAQQASQPLVVIMDLMGGAIARVAPDATAFVHRRALFSAQYYIPEPLGVAASQVAAARAVTTGMRGRMSAWSSGEAYQNYLDPQLANWQAAYYGANYARLAQVKAAYDPNQVFKPLQGISPQ